MLTYCKLLLSAPGHACSNCSPTIWNSLPANETTDPAANLVAPERHLARYTAGPRQAFLLTAVEGFS